MNKRSLPALIALLLALAPHAAEAFSLADGKLFVNGNGQWSFQKTGQEETAYLLGDSDGDWHTAMFDLLTVAKPTDDLTVNAQMGFEGEGVELEWAFIEWRLRDAFRLRAGKTKQPLGNYAEIQFVGTGRPFYDLPTAVYGPAGIAADAYQGIGVTGDLPFGDGWNLQYDLWGGAMNLETYEPFDWFNGELTPPAPAPALEESRIENIIGARASVAMPNGWTFRLSGYGGRAESDEEGAMATHLTGGASVWYRGEKLWLSGEAFVATEGDWEKSLGAYAEAGWFLTEKIQVAGRYELLRANIENLPGLDPLEKHDAYTAGASYWITPSAVLRASVDYVNGARFLRDEAWDEAAETGTDLTVAPGRTVGTTFRFVLGTQFTF